MMKSRERKTGDKKEIKVTYISSPMKVKTNASNFRALVQELTGQDSNVADTFITMPMDIKANNDTNNNGADYDEHVSSQQWRMDESTLLKPDYNEFLSRSLMEPLNEHFQFHHELLSFDDIMP
ncbi:uncharacterized protein LOC130946067 [Arachis stenosperma]|uniref:uncharacterized protein LOC130946067 n=1 Tax=Arachis stenosperma TaxID=217475 RepID=UPI0025ABA27B|nr:uncharacterized protein LOC130946067 [Arachis stenosperma]